ncbi:Cys-tRNA(Pro) deacylase [Sphingobacterium wenxiniae]|uniref:Cys-tRNA(Pro)/Cys-tRNA(Cys) deacylase n=1 Tax=Sphingobacterium wenxiniae TaxID=683125 RepID=A0A1I6TFD4_9SPHI|nr:Cys-tRNA(Pro) deacylase [Sphingobacterium wenxiniae]SFS87747.1 Cys-tRNA(Pro)/Cys-tRNA(Cys) deacylase [Sphingobacterium wenxiniae]
MSQKTNAIRILEQLNIDFELQEYKVDEEDLSAEHVAAVLGIPADSIYKTLVLTGMQEPYLVALIPGDSHLDFKKMAKVSGNKSCEMLPLKDLQKITGYVRGGCSPIGMKKSFPTYIEEFAALQEKIIISAGKRGLQICITPQDVQKCTDAVFADLVK